MANWFRKIVQREPEAPSTDRRASSAGAVPFRPMVVQLEDRSMPSVFTGVGVNTNISNTFLNQNIASLAIDPTNPNHLVVFSDADAASNDGTTNAGMYFYNSLDGGVSWTRRLFGFGPEALPPPDPGPTQPIGEVACAIDRFGNIFVTWIDVRGDGFGSNDAVRAAFSSDGGTTFTALGELDTEDCQKPHVATGPSATNPLQDQVFFTWQSGQTNLTPVIRVEGLSTAGLGAIGGLGPVIDVPGSGDPVTGIGGNFPVVAIGPAGQLLVTYQVAPSGLDGPSTIQVNLDPDGVGPIGFGPSIFVTATAIGWGTTIPAQSSTANLDPITEGGINANAFIMYDRSGGPNTGRVYLVYVDATQPTIDDFDTNVYVRFSDTNGATWSNRILVNNDNTDADQFLPMLAVDQTLGWVNVAWYDTRDSLNDQSTEIWGAVSLDGGLTYTPNVQISTGSSNSSTSGATNDFGYRFTTEARNGIFYPLWSDNSPDINPFNMDLPTLDVATARVRIRNIRDIFITGADGGGGPNVRVFDGRSSTEIMNFLAYDPSFTGGVRVAAGDVNGDSVADIITAPGRFGGPHIKIFDGRTGLLLSQFYAYAPNFIGGVFVASGDLDGDGVDEIITGADLGGGPHVKAFHADGSLYAEFYAYDSDFIGGVRVAAGDVDDNGHYDIITGAGQGGGPHVKIVDGRNLSVLASFYAYDASYLGGVYVSSADLGGTGYAEIITGPGIGAAPIVRVFGTRDIIFTGGDLDFTRQIFEFSALDGLPDNVLSLFADDVAYRNGVRVGAVNLTGDSRWEILVGSGTGARPLVRIFPSGPGTRLDEFFAYNFEFLGGVFVGGI